MYSNIINIIFVGFGLYAIINPMNISLEEIEKSYTTPDIIKCWGIYSLTIGALLIFPQPYYKKPILRVCFISSIIWHLGIVKRYGWTLRHTHSIIVNFVMFILSCY